MYLVDPTHLCTWNPTLVAFRTVDRESRAALLVMHLRQTTVDAHLKQKQDTKHRTTFIPSL